MASNVSLSLNRYWQMAGLNPVNCLDTRAKVKIVAALCLVAAFGFAGVAITATSFSAKPIISALLSVISAIASRNLFYRNNFPQDRANRPANARQVLVSPRVQPQQAADERQNQAFSNQDSQHSQQEADQKFESIPPAAVQQVASPPAHSENKVLEKAIQDLEARRIGYETFKRDNKGYRDLLSGTQINRLKTYFKETVIKNAMIFGYVELAEKFSEELAFFKISLSEIVDLRAEQDKRAREYGISEAFAKKNGKDYIEAMHKKQSLLSGNIRLREILEMLPHCQGVVTKADIETVLTNTLQREEYRTFVHKYSPCVGDGALLVMIKENFSDDFVKKVHDKKIADESHLGKYKILVALQPSNYTEDQIFALVMASALRQLHGWLSLNISELYGKIKQEEGEDFALKALKDARYQVKLIESIVAKNRWQCNIKKFKQDYQKEIAVLNLNDEAFVRTFKDLIYSDLGGDKGIEFFENSDELIKAVLRNDNLNWSLNNAFLRAPSKVGDYNRAVRLLGIDPKEMPAKIFEASNNSTYAWFKERYPLNWLKQNIVFSEAQTKTFREMFVKELQAKGHEQLTEEDYEFLGCAKETFVKK